MLLVLPELSEKLAGCTKTVRLLPLAQAEFRNSQSFFLDPVFDGDRPITEDMAVRNDLGELVLAGGYPEVHRGFHFRATGMAPGLC